MNQAALSLLLCSMVYGAAPGEVAYTIETVAGGTFCRDGWQATDAYLGSPEGIAVDRAGNVYVADSMDHRIRKIDPSGIITTIAGNGYPGFRGDGGPAAAAQLNEPYGLAFDAAGSLYIADLGNNRVRKILPSGVIQTVAGGGEANAGSAGTDLAVMARLNQPRDVAVDAGDNLFISDFKDHRVYKVRPDGVIERVAGSGVPGSIGDADRVPALSAPLHAPAGLAVDHNGTLYVADSENGAIRKVKGGVMTTVPNLPRLKIPTGVALGAGGVLYVADKGLAQVVTATGTVAGTGVAGYSGDGGPAAAAQLHAPRGLAFGPAGILYIADRSASGIVRVVQPSGVIGTVAGGSGFRPPGDNGPAVEGNLKQPSGVAVASDGTLYIADQLNNRVRQVRNDTITTVAGGEGAGWSGDGGPGTEAKLYQPMGLTLDADGALWILQAVGEADRFVRQLSPTGIISSLTTPSLNSPEGIAVDGAGNLYIADTSDDRVVTVPMSGLAFTFAGTGVPGYGGDGGQAAEAMLHNPRGVAADGAGDLYIADSLNHAIRKVDAQGTIRTMAGTGTPAFGGDGGPAASAQLSRPSGVALDAAGNLYIADTGNHRIRKVAPNGVITTIAGTGTAGWSGDGGPALSAEMREPVALAVDGQGNIFVADRGNNVIRRLAPVTEVAPELSGIVSSASLLPGAVAPGEIVTLFGTALGPAEGALAEFAAPGMLVTELSGIEVFFDQTPAALLGVGPRAIYLQVPYEVAGRGSVAVELRKSGSVIARVLAGVAASAPALYADQGVGQAAALNEDGTLNSAARPARQGSAVTLYATGEGQTQPAGVSGRVAQAACPMPQLPVSVTIGGQLARVLFAGCAMGTVGVMELDVRLPLPLASGNQEVVLTVGAAHSQPGVTVAVR